MHYCGNSKQNIQIFTGCIFDVMIYFVPSFFDQHVQPFAQVGRKHVHQTETHNHFVSFRFEFNGIQKDELHLHNWENHSGGRR